MSNTSTPVHLLIYTCCWPTIAVVNFAVERIALLLAVAMWGITPQVSIDKGNEGEEYSYSWHGSFTCPEARGNRGCEMRFRTTSDDASYVILDGKVVVNNGGGHSSETVTSDKYRLSAGGVVKEIRILYGQCLRLCRFAFYEQHRSARSPAAPLLNVLTNLTAGLLRFCVFTFSYLFL